MMKRLRFVLILLLLPACLAGQSLLVGTASASTGKTVAIPVTLDTHGASITVLQFDLAYNGGEMSVSVTPGPAAEGAGKTLAYNPEARRIVLAGLNQNAFADGVVAVLRVSRRGIARRAHAIALERVSACDQYGNTVPLHSNSAQITGTELK